MNAVNRAKQIRQGIERPLGVEAIEVGMEWESPDQVRERTKEMKSSLYTDKRTDEDEPEVRRQIEAHLQEQAEEGVYTKVPVPDRRTPIEAVADPDGREMLEALLEGFERQNEIPAEAAIVRADVGVLCRLLKLFR